MTFFATFSIASDLTFGSRLTLHLGSKMEVRLLGFVAHTRGDTVIHLPRQGILATGDLLGELPYAGHGYPSQWSIALDTLETLEFDTVVPGHGPVLPGKRRLRRVRELLISARRQAQAAVASGLVGQRAQEAIDLERFRHSLTGGEPVAERNFDHFILALAERALAEARGEIDRGEPN